MTSFKIGAGLAALLVAATLDAAPPAKDGVELVSGKTVTATSRASDPVDVYYFIGHPGSRAVLQVASKEPVEVTLFEPSGGKMLAEAGSGTVKLEAVLSTLDVHTVSIARAKPSAGYTIRLEATEPAFGEVILALNAGYYHSQGSGERTSCWLVPGLKKRITYLNGNWVIFSLLADKATIRTDGPKGSAGEFKNTIEGDDLVRTWTRTDGSSRVHRTKLNPADLSFDGKTQTFRSYLCDEATPTDK